MPSIDFSASHPIRSTWQFLDVLLFFLSPLAIIGFLIVVIVGLDRFGAHVQLVRALNQTYVETSGEWSPPAAERDMGYVTFDHPEQGWDGMLIDTKYYSKETLAALRKGQVVHVRYTYPPKHELEAILADEYAQVKRYTGHLTDLFWPLLFCWLIVAVHPEFLYVGFADPFQKSPARTASSEEAVSPDPEKQP